MKFKGIAAAPALLSVLFLFICTRPCFCRFPGQHESDPPGPSQEEVLVPRALAKDTWHATHDGVKPTLGACQPSQQPSGALVSPVGFSALPAC